MDERNDDVQTIGKLVLYKNSLIFKNTAIQISNICSIWVADHSYVILHKTPGWIPIAAIIGALMTLFGLGDPPYLVSIGGVVLCVVAFLAYKKHKPDTSIPKFALGIELSSGRSTLFTSPDIDFVQKSAKALIDNISEKRTSSEKLVMNFEDKSINIGSVTGSNVIGGDVNDSLVESL